MPNIRRPPTMLVPVNPRAGRRVASWATTPVAGAVTTGLAVVVLTIASVAGDTRIALAVAVSAVALAVVVSAVAVFAADGADDETRSGRL